MRRIILTFGREQRGSKTEVWLSLIYLWKMLPFSKCIDRAPDEEMITRRKYYFSLLWLHLKSLNPNTVPCSLRFLHCSVTLHSFAAVALCLLSANICLHTAANSHFSTCQYSGYSLPSNCFFCFFLLYNSCFQYIVTKQTSVVQWKKSVSVLLFMSLLPNSSHMALLCPTECGSGNSICCLSNNRLDMRLMSMWQPQGLLTCFRFM